MTGAVKESLIEDLRRLGITTGDTVYFRADLFVMDRSLKVIRAFIDASIELVGPEGTIACPTFTRGGAISLRNERRPFDQDTPSTSGSLASLFLEHPSVVRSKHPLCSFAAIGKNAGYICTDHDESKPPYWPMSRMMDLDAKQVIFGCVMSNPGFTTVHWAQHTLGLASRHRNKGDYGAEYKKNGKTELFIAKERGGCNRGFDKFYSRYKESGILTSGRVGNAEAICTRMKKAFKIEEEILRKSPRFALCDNPWCGKCRFMWGYNKRDLPMFYLRHLLKRFTR